MSERVIMSVETADQSALRPLLAVEREEIATEFREALKSRVAVLFPPPGRKINLLHYSADDASAKSHPVEAHADAEPIRLVDVTAQMVPPREEQTRPRDGQTRRSAKA